MPIETLEDLLIVARMHENAAENAARAKDPKQAAQHRDLMAHYLSQAARAKSYAR